MTSDYNEFVQRVLRDEVYDDVFRKDLEDLLGWFPRRPLTGGDRITEKFEVARNSPATSYDKSDVDPVSATNTLVKPYWDKTQDHTAAEVSNIDISNAKAGGTDLDLVRQEVMKEAASLKDTVWSKVMTQLKADVHSSATTYSDKGLSRSTYPVLASYLEDTDTAVTLALVRGMVNTVMLNKNNGPLQGYIGLFEQAVYNKFKPLAAAVHTWTINDAASGQSVDTGYQPVRSFEELAIEKPQGMTTGDILMLRRQDVLVSEHRPMEITQVPSGKDSVKFVIRLGLDAHVVHPGFQGKMTDKD